MQGLIAFARRHQLALFFVLAYAFSWWAWVWYRLDPANVDAPILPIGPLLAALAMLALVGGWDAIRHWLAKIVHWRVAPVWYFFALLVPPALTLAAVGINRFFGATVVAEATVPGWQAIAVQFVFIFLWIGLGEEPAWRGYALPRLMKGRPALVAALILGAFHAIWHLPLFGVEYDLANGLPWLISVFCVSIVIAWVWLHTAGSLLMPMLLHASNNTIASVAWRWFAGADQLRLWWIWALLWVTMTVLIVVLTGRRLTRNQDNQM
jgi:uncharacterized protein